MKHYVYFLLNESKVVYIGCTKRLDRRIKEHKSSGKKFTSHRAIECVDLETAENYERRWIKRFKPEYNGAPPPKKNPSAKQAMCVHISKDVADKLREFAADQQKNISVIIENALAGFYNL